MRPEGEAGTQALGRWVVKTYGGGYGRISEPCKGGSVSEHKEGRAFDWSLNAAQGGRPDPCPAVHEPALRDRPVG